MSDENKKPESAAQTAVTAPEPAQPAKPEAKGKAKTEAKGKGKTKPKAKPEAGGALQSIGFDACKRHGLAEVWVTSDGQSFARQSDARNHAANLKDKQTINVKAE